MKDLKLKSDQILKIFLENWNKDPNFIDNIDFDNET